MRYLLRDGIPFALIRAYQLTPGARWLASRVASGSTSQTALRAISEGMGGWKAISVFGRVAIMPRWDESGGGGAFWGTSVGGFAWDQAGPDRF